MSAADLPAATAFDAFRCEAERLAFQEDLQRRAQRQALPPIQWPEPFPFDARLAMRAAAYAKEIGRVVPFAQAAFRQAFAGGHALDREDFVLIAAAACEMHPRAVLSAVQASATAQRLGAAAQIATGHGVTELPALVCGSEVIEGEGALRAVEEQPPAMHADSPIGGLA